MTTNTVRAELIELRSEGNHSHSRGSVGHMVGSAT